MQTEKEKKKEVEPMVKERTQEDAKASAGCVFPVCSFDGLVLMLSLAVFSPSRSSLFVVWRALQSP